VDDHFDHVFNGVLYFRMILESKKDY